MGETYIDVLVKVAASLLAVAGTLVVNRSLRNLLRIRVANAAHLHTLHMLARNAVFVAGTIVLLFIWLGTGANVTGRI